MLIFEFKNVKLDTRTSSLLLKLFLILAPNVTYMLNPLNASFALI